MNGENVPGQSTPSLIQFPHEFLKRQCTEISVLDRRAVHNINVLFFFVLTYFHDFLSKSHTYSKSPEVIQGQNSFFVSKDDL